MDLVPEQLATSSLVSYQTRKAVVHSPAGKAGFPEEEIQDVVDGPLASSLITLFEVGGGPGRRGDAGDPLDPGTACAWSRTWARTRCPGRRDVPGCLII